jgi:RNA polymerase sigma factor (sigma-70 family)
MGMRGVTTQIIRQLSAAADRRTDGELLGGFLTRNVEADFAELVRRYGSMVWSVCRRTLPDRADAEDAFQTVFLVLVRRGKKLVGLPTVGPWLHRVAVWTARNVRRRNAHRLAKRVTLTEALPAARTNRDLSLDLDNALLALPEKFRSSIVLCHLLGFSRADAAAQLGCPEGTLSAWLSRGLEKLRTKLGDLDPARTLGIAAVAVPAGLSGSVVRAAVAFQATAATAMASALSSAVPQLVEGVIRMFWVKKATAATVALFAVFAFGVGVGVSTHQLAPASGGQDNTAPLRSGVPTAPSERLDVAVEEPDIDTILAELEEQLRAAFLFCRTAMEGVKLAEERVALGKQQKIDPKDLENDLETLARFQKSVDDAKKKMEELRTPIIKLREYKVQLAKAGALKDAKLKLKAPPEQPDPNKVQLKTKAPPAILDDLDVQLKTKAPPAILDDLDKKLDELKKLQAKLQLETANFKRNEMMLQDQLKKIADEIAALQKKKEASAKEPPATKATGAAYFQLTVGTKDAAWPFQIKEFSFDGKAIGTTAFENAAVLGRFLTRAMKDSAAPKEVRIAAQENTPREMLASAIEVCKAAGTAQTPLKIGNDELIRDRLIEDTDALLKDRMKKARDAFDEKVRDKTKKVLDENEEEVRDKAKKALERDAAKERDALKLLEAFDMKRKELEDLKRKEEMERIYRDAIRRAEELLKKQKQDDPANKPKP